MKSARQSVADYVNKNNGSNVTSSYMTSGCTVSLETCFRALVEPGENILVYIHFCLIFFISQYCNLGKMAKTSRELRSQYLT